MCVIIHALIIELFISGPLQIIIVIKRVIPFTGSVCWCHEVSYVPENLAM